MGALGRAGKPRREVAIRTRTFTRASVYPFLSWEKGALSPCPHARHLQWSVPSLPDVTRTGPGTTPLSGPGQQTHTWSSAPLPFLSFLPSGWSTPCLSCFGKWSGGCSGHRTPSAFNPRPEARDEGFRGTRLGRGPGRGGWGAAAEAVDITAESARLSRRCGDRRAFAPLPTSPFPQPEPLRQGRTAAGVGRGVVVSRGVRGGSPIPRPLAVKVNVKESGRACPRLWVRARAPPGSRPRCPRRPPAGPPARAAPPGPDGRPGLERTQVRLHVRPPPVPRTFRLTSGGAFCCAGVCPVWSAFPGTRG